MKPTFPLAVFSTRQAQLDDARVESQLACDRQLATEQMAAEFRLIDFLAEGFAEYQRRYRALPFDAKLEAAFERLHQTPEEFGAEFAPEFLDVLKYVAARRSMAHLDEVLALP